MSDVLDLYQAILGGDSQGARTSARRAMAAEVDPTQLFTVGVMRAMREARRRFQAHECYVPEMLIACHAMKAAMHELRPRLAAGGFRPNARVSVISLTYQAEDLAAGLVADLLQGDGFEVTQSNLAVPEAERVKRWQIAEAKVVVVVMPTLALVRGPMSWQALNREAVERLCRDCAKSGGKIILVGIDSSRTHDFGLDANVDDFADVVPTVERLAQNAAFA